MRVATSLYAATAALTLTMLPAWAADDHKPKNGGQVRETMSFDLELVAKADELVLHIADHKGKKVNTKDATATATIITGKSKDTVKLAASGDGVFKGKGTFALTAETKILVSVVAAGKTEQTRFAPLQKEKTEDHKGHKH